MPPLLTTCACLSSCASQLPENLTRKQLLRAVDRCCALLDDVEDATQLVNQASLPYVEAADGAATEQARVEAAAAAAACAAAAADAEAAQQAAAQAQAELTSLKASQAQEVERAWAAAGAAQAKLVGASSSQAQELEQARSAAKAALAAAATAQAELAEVRAAQAHLRDSAGEATPSLAQRPPPAAEGAAERLHLLFLVHGIGQHDDFVDGAFLNWDGSEGMSGGNHEFREHLENLVSSRFREVGLSLTVASVEWHSALHSSGVDEVLEKCAPDGVPGLRSFFKSTIMDAICYTGKGVGRNEMGRDGVGDGAGWGGGGWDGVGWDVGRVAVGRPPVGVFWGRALHSPERHHQEQQ